MTLFFYFRISLFLYLQKKKFNYYYDLLSEKKLYTRFNYSVVKCIPLDSEIRRDSYYIYISPGINKTKNLISKATIILKYEKLNSILQRPLLSNCHHLNNPVYVTRNGN